MLEHFSGKAKPHQYPRRETKAVKVYSEAIPTKEQTKDHELERLRTSIGIKMTTKDKLDKNRAPGQCYNGLIYQLVDLWERTNGK